jgi:hypothetical protein
MVSKSSVQCHYCWFNLFYPTWNLECPQQYVIQNPYPNRLTFVDTGAGGQQEPYLVNGANSLTFGIMVFGCSLFSILANKIGLKWVLLIGTLGYAPYSAALYTNNRYGTEWFVLLGGATCGIGASALWASEGAIALGYGDIKDRGKFSTSILGVYLHF